MSVPACRNLPSQRVVSRWKGWEGAGCLATGLSGAMRGECCWFPSRSCYLSLRLSPALLLPCPPAQCSGCAGFGSQPSVDYQAVRVHAGEVTFLSEPSYACCFLKSQLGFPTSSPSDSGCVRTELLCTSPCPCCHPSFFQSPFLVPMITFTVAPSLASPLLLQPKNNCELQTHDEVQELGEDNLTPFCSVLLCCLGCRAVERCLLV